MRKIMEIMKRDAEGRFVATNVVKVFGGAFEHGRIFDAPCLTTDTSAERCSCRLYTLEWVNA